MRWAGDPGREPSVQGVKLLPVCTHGDTMNSIEAVPDEALEDVAYLARSPNRVRILQALVSTPASPREFRERTGTSKTTCNRILTEFAERSWARQTVDGTYEATPRAHHVATQFRPFVDSMATIQALGDGLSVLPVDDLVWGPDGQLTLGVHHFADATVKWKAPQQQGVGRAALAEAFRTTSTIHTISAGAPPRTVGEVVQDRADREEISGIAVFTTELFEYLREQHVGPPDWKDVIESGVETFRYDGSTPNNLTVTDESTFIWGEATDGTYGVVITRDDVVREWGRDVVKRYRDRAERIDPATFD